MTKLTAGRALTRETDAKERGDPLVVALHPNYLSVRIKGRREVHNFTYELLLAIGRRHVFEHRLQKRGHK